MKKLIVFLLCCLSLGAKAEWVSLLNWDWQANRSYDDYKGQFPSYNKFKVVVAYNPGPSGCWGQAQGVSFGYPCGVTAELIWDRSGDCVHSNGGNEGVALYVYGDNGQNSRTVTINVSPTNTGTALCTTPTPYYDGQWVVLTASPLVGYHFVSWSGGTFSNNTSSASNGVQISGNMTLTATFASDVVYRTLTVNISPANTAICNQGGTYTNGTVVNLNPIKAPNYAVDHYDGTDNGTNAVTMSADKTVTIYMGIDADGDGNVDNPTGGGGGYGDMDNDVPAINAMSSSLGGKLDSVNGSVQGVVTSLADIKDGVQDIYSNTQAWNSTFESINTNASNIYSSLQDLVSKIDDLKSAVTDNKSVLDSIDSTAKSMDTKLGKLNDIYELLSDIKDALASTGGQSVDSPEFNAPEAPSAPELPELNENTPFNPDRQDLNTSFMDPVRENITALKNSSPGQMNDWVIPFSKLYSGLEDLRFNFTGMENYEVLNELRQQCRIFFSVLVWIYGVIQWVNIVKTIFDVL